MNRRNTLLGLTAVGLLAAVAGAQEYVRTTPAFAPNGDSIAPWNSIALGVWGSTNNAHILIQPGDYFEPGVFDPPHTVTLETTGAPVRIAAQLPQRSSLRVASYNTHLFGLDVIPGLPRWMDESRSLHIGRVAVTENADIFLMQEVWDPSLCGAIQLMTMATYPSGFYGGNIDGIGPLNSGLFTFSKHPLFSTWQFFYNDEDGVVEGMASKGYIRTVFTKDGFTVAVFNTHTQSGESGSASVTRQKQIIQLSNDIKAWRQANPSHIVIVGGDFNAIDTTSEYVITMKSALGDLNLIGDGAANYPVVDGPSDCTTCYDNDLRRYFSPDNTQNWRIDYILYANSLDGSARIVPKSYAIRRYEIPAGYPDLCDDGICTRDLSDHYGMSMDFEMQRY